MSTNALIAYKNEKGNYNINSIHWDGYIEGGVGQTLIEDWKNPLDIQRICKANEIRCLGSSYNESEFFDTWTLENRRNVSFDKLCNISGNYDYTYVYEDNMWRLLKAGTLTKYM